MGYWQGIDVAGPALSLVTIDKIPFPRPDEPLWQARREAAGPRRSARSTCPAPRPCWRRARAGSSATRPTAAWSPCSTHGSRPTRATAGTCIAALPPMRRTKDLDDVAEFLGDTDA